MIKLTVNVEEYNMVDLMSHADHIAVRISQGATEGEGWNITGDAEKRPISPEEKDEIKELEEMEKVEEELSEEIINK